MTKREKGGFAMTAIQFATNSLPFHLFQDYMNLTVTFLKYSNNYENQKDNFLIMQFS